MINNGSIAIKAIAILMDVVGSFATSAPIFPATLPPVSYTHLDVYKRQV